jgi:hypothetical protein
MNDKVCTKCKQTKPVSEFYAGKRGVRFQCKECEKSASKLYYYNNTDKVIARVDRYRKENGRKRKPGTPEQVRAYRMVKIAIKDGILVKPDECELCGKESHLHGHHWDGYNNPLKVIWLCPTCHHMAHGRGKGMVEGKRWMYAAKIANMVAIEYLVMRATREGCAVVSGGRP